MLPAPTTGGPACTTIYFNGTTNVDAVAPDNINAAGEGFTLSAWVLRANAGYETAGDVNVWERIIDFGNGAGQDNIYLAFDANPWWDDSLSCCYPRCGMVCTTAPNGGARPTCKSASPASHKTSGQPCS